MAGKNGVRPLQLKYMAELSHEVLRCWHLYAHQNRRLRVAWEETGKQKRDDYFAEIMVNHFLAWRCVVARGALVRFMVDSASVLPPTLCPWPSCRNGTLEEMGKRFLRVSLLCCLQVLHLWQATGPQAWSTILPEWVQRLHAVSDLS